MVDDTQNLLRLADEVAAATGPDRRLDMTIKAAVYGAVCLMSPFNGEWCLYRQGTAGPRGGKAFERPRSVSHEVWQNDRYTGSLDAAMALVPEGYCYTQGNKAEWRMNADAWAWCEPESLDWSDSWNTYAATPALALCAAALKARAHSTKELHHG